MENLDIAGITDHMSYNLGTVTRIVLAIGYDAGYVDPLANAAEDLVQLRRARDLLDREISRREADEAERHQVDIEQFARPARGPDLQRVVQADLGQVFADVAASINSIKPVRVPMAFGKFAQGGPLVDKDKVAEEAQRRRDAQVAPRPPEPVTTEVPGATRDPFEGGPPAPLYGVPANSEWAADVIRRQAELDAGVRNEGFGPAEPIGPVLDAIEREPSETELEHMDRHAAQQPDPERVDYVRPYLDSEPGGSTPAPGIRLKPSPYPRQPTHALDTEPAHPEDGR